MGVGSSLPLDPEITCPMLCGSSLFYGWLSWRKIMSVCDQEESHPDPGLHEQGCRPWYEGVGWQSRARYPVRPHLHLCPVLCWAFPDSRGAGAGRAGWKVLEGRTGLSSCSY